MFELRKQLVTDFRDYVESFLNIADPDIRAFLQRELDRGALWPEPLLQINPTFEPGDLVDELAERGTLHRQCGAIFRRGRTAADPVGSPLRLFRHQVQAIEVARAGNNMVLTTGTGSGKSLCYMLPIVDHVLRAGSGSGIRAVVVYPMNALANSQEGELNKYLRVGAAPPPVTYSLYTGQQRGPARDEIRSSPPDVLLTNFMMLELILTRPYERELVNAMRNLQFVVLDELHTYRGRQGSDVAMLMRRLRDISGSPHIQCIGTSATMATEGSAAQRRQAVAEVASRLFGDQVHPAHVIGETLRPFSPPEDTSSDAFTQRLGSTIGAAVPQTLDGFREHPLTVWLEHKVGLDKDDEGTLVRAVPRALYGEGGVAAKLAETIGGTTQAAEAAVVSHLLGAAALPQSDGPRPFVSRLHQFLSPGLGVFGSLGIGADRFLTLDGQKTDPRSADRPLYPMCFCRQCGQHYYIATDQVRTEEPNVLVPRMLHERPLDEGDTATYVYIPPPGVGVDLHEMVPDDWRDASRGGRLKKSREKCMPLQVRISESGKLGGDLNAWLIPVPFSLCLNPECRAAYSTRESEISKLSILGMQGRSTATTTLGLATVDYLQRRGAANRKLLSFTDNRQDASLQAGHLNDFVDVGMIRAAIYAAAERAGEEGLTHDHVAQQVAERLDLQQEDYAQQVSNLPRQITEKRKALLDVLGYRIYRDLRRGWRINAPNLEQVGLVRIAYPDLEFVCADEARWSGTHEALEAATPQCRQMVAYELLERLRRRLAIKVDYLDPDYHEQIRRRSSQHLKEPWALSDDEAFRMESGAFGWLVGGPSSEERTDIALTPRSGYGMWLRQPSRFPHLHAQLATDEVGKVIEDLTAVLIEAGMLSKSRPVPEADALQLNADVFVWVAADPEEAPRRTRNAFFERFYRDRALTLKGIRAREHTAQVTTVERQEREEAFRSGALPILFCSPTMELGVDISDLSVVNMRNVPPTPANYAQRSGRAGRSGQPALVYTYCTAGSPHDQYYFRRPEQMVSGAVAPPRLDLANEDLVRAHVHAVWLTEAGLDLGSSLTDRILDLPGVPPTLALQPAVSDVLADTAVRGRARERARVMLDAIGPELQHASWYKDRWLDDTIAQIPLAFDRACDRWRNLYRGAFDQAKRSADAALDHSASPDARKLAERLRAEATAQMNLLTDPASEMYADFGAYRYLAGEGFVPGYNFPRLPLSAYIPARRGKDEYLSRPRFLAISEFGPGAVVYHEGSRYLVDRIPMPTAARSEGGKLVTRTAKLCTECGYLHAGDGAGTVSVCEHCCREFTAEDTLSGLFRLEAAVLRRRDRITCDEEERMRQGYEIRTGLRFDRRSGDDECLSAEIATQDGACLAHLAYAQAATIWRVNLGWNRRKVKGVRGYQLDVDKGRWLSEPGANTLMEQAGEAAGHRVERVVPYVEDRRNVLVLAWQETLADEEIASLQAALKSAILAVFQIEDSELAAEPMPSADVRRQILFYEAAEGGAGVLRRLIDEPASLRKVVATALEICHFDPETLEDRKRHPKAREDCSTACYDCLMSYNNQRDHLLLDRHKALPLLEALRGASVKQSVGWVSRSAKLESLLKRCQSDLERRWLERLDERGMNLPTHAQYRIEACGTVPDFVYIHGATQMAVYIDGPAHDYPERQARDAGQDLALLGAGWLTLRFGHADDWDALIATQATLFGGKA